MVYSFLETEIGIAKEKFKRITAILLKTLTDWEIILTISGCFHFNHNAAVV